MFSLESYRRCEKPFVLRLTIAIVSLIVAILIIILMFTYIKKTNSDIEYTPYEGLKTLHLTSILFRHGARTPREIYNSDPHKNYKWPGGFGALTNEGKQQLFQLGKTIRQRYNGFIPENYSEEDVYMKSSDRSRTLMSAYMFLAGLYPPTPEQTWNHEIAWQPIPARSLPRELDMLLGAKKNCSEYNEHEKNYVNLLEYKNITKNYTSLYEALSIYTNQTVDNPRTLEVLFDTLFIEEHAGLKLPEWTKQFYPDRLREICAFSLTTNTFDDFMIRVKGGPLLSEILNNMKKKKNAELKPNRKMFLYSAHDITIVNLWRALSFKEYFIPEYGAALVFELHELTNSTDFEVKLFYFNNTVVKEPHRLDIPNCKSPCLLLNLEEVNKKYIPLDWEKECKNS